MSQELEICNAEIQALRQATSEYLDSNLKLRTLTILTQNRVASYEAAAIESAKVKEELEQRIVSFNDTLKVLADKIVELESQLNTLAVPASKAPVLEEA